MAIEKVSTAAIDYFKKIAKYDVKAIMERFVNFAQSGALQIYNYYNGDSTIYPTNAFDELTFLQKELIKITEIFRVNGNLFSGYDYWIMLELVEDAIGRLDTIANYSAWLRSPILDGKYGRGVEIDYILRGGQTLEQVSDELQGTSEPQDEWVDLAMRNSLNEEGYDVGNGGAILKVKFNNQNTLFLNAVVDNINTADKTFGLDINRNFILTDNDLETLTYKDTIEQAAEILTGLKKGDNPFHPNDGIDEKAVIGNSISAISFPIIFRQLVNTFSKDDTFSSIAIIDVSRNSDGVFIEFNIETTAGEVIRQGVLV